ncbi:MAG: YqgE/AlgH family protein [Bacteroidales bacterium]
MAKNLNIDFFRIEGSTLQPQKGRILIAEPFLNDNYFKRSVVLLTEHGKEGTVGFVLNKPIDIAVPDIIEGFPSIDASVSIGGPVQTNTVHYIHTLGDLIPNSIPVLEGIYWGGDFDVLKELVLTGACTGSQIRFFVGYSGWKPKQLEGELEQNAWVVADIKPEMVMKYTSESVWKNTLEKLGEKYRIWINTPENPGLN